MIYDILYRGIKETNTPNPNGMWLSTSEEYASLYGKVLEYQIPLSVLDNLASEQEALEYCLDDSGEEYPFYDDTLFDIDKMKKIGYSGYYYIEEEYCCLNVFLFN